MTTSYPSNLTQDQWELLLSLIPAAKPGGRPRSVDLQAVMNAILYVLCAGCAGSHVAFATSSYWKTVYHYFRAWRLDGTWQLCEPSLASMGTKSKDRALSKSAAILDSQSVSKFGGQTSLTANFA